MPGSVFLYGLGLVALLSTGRIDIRTAVILAVAPVALSTAILRPEWLLVLVVLVPPALMALIPPTYMIAVMTVTLFGFFLYGKLHLGPGTGVYPLIGIILLAIAWKADVPDEAAATASTLMNFLIYYALLMLAAFHATANQRLSASTFVDALLVGIVIAALLQPMLPTVTGIEGFSRNPYQGTFANLAVMAFGITYIRRSLAASVGEPRSPVDGFLMVVFLALTIVSYNRAAYIAVLLCFALVWRWTAKKTVWIVVALVVALAFTVPVIRDAIAPSSSSDTSNRGALERVTSGRSVLWEDLWNRGVAALPYGNGWGYMWSLTSVQLFGFEGEFSANETGLIYPHNDFLFLFLELGVAGVSLMVIFWIQFIRRFRSLSRSPGWRVRYDARTLAPVGIIMFLLQLFANGLSVRFVAERFFVTAGLIGGMWYAERGRTDRARRAMMDATDMVVAPP